MGRGVRVAAVAAVVVLAASCGGADDAGPEAAGDGAPLVLATTSIWADVTANVACDGLATVEAVIPAGADAHSFEPSLTDRRRLADAVLVVENGLDLEESLTDTLEAAEADGARLFTVADHVTVTAGVAAPDDADGDEPEGGDADGHDHDHAVDPHLWLDPRLVDEALGPLGEALVAQGGLDAGAVETCLSDYRQQLAAADAEVAALVAQLEPEQRVLVTSHDSFGRFADRYGFEVIGSIVASTSSLAEASPAALEELASLVESTGVRAIFTDEATDAADARALADRVGGVPVVALHTESLGEPGSPAATYLDLLRHDARLIVDALQGANP